MAKNYSDNINRSSVLSEVDEDNDIYTEKIDSLLYKNKEEDDEKIGRCKSIRNFLRFISLGKYNSKFYTF
jgi:hypothetical protein